MIVLALVLAYCLSSSMAMFFGNHDRGLMQRTTFVSFVGSFLTFALLCYKGDDMGSLIPVVAGVALAVGMIVQAMPASTRLPVPAAG